MYIRVILSTQSRDMRTKTGGRRFEPMKREKRLTLGERNAAVER